MADKILDARKLLKGTRLEKSADCVAKVFENQNITTLEQVDNLPAMGHICFCDVYQLCAIIREQYLKATEPAKEPELLAKPEEKVTK